jgi:pimeloyl-ACP methyl ester carboxylesterase
VTSGIPLLVVAGDSDPLVTPEYVHGARGRVAERARGGVDCGHLPNWERPDEFNRMLSAFVSSL